MGDPSDRGMPGPSDIDQLVFAIKYEGIQPGVVDMGERKLDLLLRFLKQGHGALSKRAKEHEFALLSDDEAERITAIYAAYF